MEVGFKGSLMGDRLAFSAALFRMQRRDVQVATSITQERQDQSAEFIQYTSNAAKGVNQGLEVEQHSSLGPAVANLGLLDTEYEDYVNGAGQDLDAQRSGPVAGLPFLSCGRLSTG